MKGNELKYIHEVLCGKERPWRKDKNLPDSNYQNLLKNTPIIPASFTGQYFLEYKKYLLFTAKVKYYCRKIDNVLVDYLNGCFRIIEKDGSEELTKYMVSDIHKNIKTLINEAKCELDNCPITIDVFNGENVDFHTLKVENEKCIILNYVISSLIKCWFEIQNKCHYIIDETDLYDIDSFYVETTGKLPNKVFMINPLKVEPPQKASKNKRTDCSFLYNNNDTENKNYAFTELRATLIKYELIPPETDLKDLMSVFSGTQSRAQIKWLKDNHILATALKRLINNLKIITTYPEITTIWQVVSCRFIDKDGNAMPNLGSESERKSTSNIVDEIVSAFTGYLQ